MVRAGRSIARGTDLHWNSMHRFLLDNRADLTERRKAKVADHRGGLPHGAAETMSRPFTQTGEDRSGPCLGLYIARRAVEADRGTLSVRDMPGTGCVFTIDMPQRALH